MADAHPAPRLGVPSPGCSWSDEVDSVLKGDMVVGAAYVTPAGGAVVTAVATCALSDRAAETVSFTTSLGFGRKLERIVREPRVALAYHTREHGFSTVSAYVLVQGVATVDLSPSKARLEAFAPDVTRFLGEVARGPIWDRLLREYYGERVFVDIAARRVSAWPALAATGEAEVSGAPWPEPPPPQSPPRGGTIARVDVTRAAGQIAGLPHRLLAYRGADGYPVVVPVAVAGHDASGLRVLAAPGLLPAGGRRAGMVAHAYRPQLIGLGTRVFTGWLDVGDDGSALYAPHTSKGLTLPPNKHLLLILNGLTAKYGVWQARRRGTAARLESLAADARSAAA